MAKTKRMSQSMSQIRKEEEERERRITRKKINVLGISTQYKVFLHLSDRV